MDFITDRIAIGNVLDASDLGTLRSRGIRSVLCLNGLAPDAGPERFGLEAREVYALKDGPGNDPWLFRRILRVVDEMSRRHPALLVHCQAGRSRSAVVVAGHLMRTEGWELDRALAFVGRRREIALTPGIIALLEDLEEESGAAGR